MWMAREPTPPPPLLSWGSGRSVLLWVHVTSKSEESLGDGQWDYKLRQGKETCLWQLALLSYHRYPNWR
jgi:hypothetical protein